MSKHLLIDEMQDYSPIQYKSDSKNFIRVEKTILGDASQSVNPYGSSTAGMIQKAFVTGEIIETFAKAIVLLLRLPVLHKKFNRTMN